MIKQFSIIVSVLVLSYIIEIGFGLPIPASIIGMLLLLILLFTKVIPLEAVENISGFLQKEITLFILPLAIGIMDMVHLFDGKFFLTLLIIILSTTLSIFATALIMKLILGKKRTSKEANSL
ncbi:CidA/LrgA family protein [Irregularibacter muris]|uniref:CidA/LrgA family protein n=1 Tax=Irregularibacter muris TaxID=1796619 RepID=A0AAE3HD78_9FIRM|nr:CidA/LrgA family protein [Irregularibacter muris]MCR1898315.1 CidA/LrgA family protein [Irregularibacter muris]